MPENARTGLAPNRNVVPSGSICQVPNQAARHAYLTLTLAPASSSFFLISSASSLETPSLTTLGAASTRFLGVGQAELSDLANRFNHVDFLAAGVRKLDIELRLLLSCFATGYRTSCYCNCRWSRRKRPIFSSRAFTRAPRHPSRSIR